MAKRRPAGPQWAPAESRRRVAMDIAIAKKCLQAAGTEDPGLWKCSLHAAAASLDAAMIEVVRVLDAGEIPLARKGRVKRGRTG